MLHDSNTCYTIPNEFMKQSFSKRNYKWVILSHQTPPKPPSSRVKIWRCLQTIGAAQLKHSVYILPFTKQTHEDFQWLRQQIIAQQGNATIFMVDSIEGINEREIEGKFRERRNGVY